MNLATIVFLAAMEGIRFPGSIQYLPKEVLEARSHGAETKVVFHVVDDEGRAVKDASVGAAFYMNGKKGYVVKGLTDANGIFEATQQSVGEVNYSIRKDDYYDTRDRIWLTGTIYKAGEVTDGKWQPYGKTYEVVLKKIRNPMAMNAYRCERAIPKQGVDLGFDLRVGDFVKPYGKGDVADFVFRHDVWDVSYWKYRAEMTLSFTNALDGVYVDDKDMFSRFVSSYQASTNANYRKKITFVYDSRNPKAKIMDLLKENQYLVLRTRTKVNEKGELTAAFYSKMYGDFKFLMQGMSFTAYVNMEPNSTNLEFDPNKNLQKFSPTVFEIRRP